MKIKNCLTCNNSFNKKAYTSKNNWSKIKYCSIKCSGRSKRTSISSLCTCCGITYNEKPSALNNKNRNFCSRTCYTKFRKESLPMEEQHAYRGVRKPGESKQIYHKNYVKSHPENISHLKSRRYARERNAEGSHTLLQWNELKLKLNNICTICREPKKLTKDHIIPLSKGGTDFITNIQPLCKNCNSKKWQTIYESPELLNP